MTVRIAPGTGPIWLCFLPRYLAELKGLSYRMVSRRDLYAGFTGAVIPSCNVRGTNLIALLQFMSCLCYSYRQKSWGCISYPVLERFVPINYKWKLWAGKNAGLVGRMRQVSFSAKSPGDS